MAQGNMEQKLYITIGGVTKSATLVDNKAAQELVARLKEVDVTVTLTDFHRRTVAEIRHTIDPRDILIRPLGDNGIPYRYVWKGGHGTDGRLTTADTLPDIKSCIDLAILADLHEGADGEVLHRLSTRGRCFVLPRAIPVNEGPFQRCSRGLSLA